MLKSRKALKLSDWEVDELLFYARSGWTPRQLGRLYGVSEKTVQRIIRRNGGGGRNGSV